MERMNLLELCRTISILVILASTSKAFSYSHRPTWVYPKGENERTTPTFKELYKKPSKSRYSWGFVATTANPQYTFPSYGFKTIQSYRDKTIQNDILQQRPFSSLISIEENVNRKINLDPRNLIPDFTTDGKHYMSGRDDHWKYLNDKDFKIVEMADRNDVNYLKNDVKSNALDNLDDRIRKSDTELNRFDYLPNFNVDKNKMQHEINSGRPTEVNPKSKIDSDRENNNYMIHLTHEKHLSQNVSKNQNHTNIYEKDYEKHKEYIEHQNSHNNQTVEYNNNHDPNKYRRNENTTTEERPHSNSNNMTEQNGSAKDEHEIISHIPEKDNNESNHHELENQHNKDTKSPKDNKKGNVHESRKFGNRNEPNRSGEDCNVNKPVSNQDKTTVAGGLKCYSCNNQTSASCQDITEYTNQTVCSEIEDRCLLILTKNIFTDKITMRRTCGHKHTCHDLDSVATEIKKCLSCQKDLCNKSTASFINYTMFSILILIRAYFMIFS